MPRGQQYPAKEVGMNGRWAPETKHTIVSSATLRWLKPPFIFGYTGHIRVANLAVKLFTLCARVNYLPPMHGRGP